MKWIQMETFCDRFLFFYRGRFSIWILWFITLQQKILLDSLHGNLWIYETQWASKKYRTQSGFSHGQTFSKVIFPPRLESLRFILKARLPSDWTKTYILSITYFNSIMKLFLSDNSYNYHKSNTFYIRNCEQFKYWIFKRIFGMLKEY